MKHYVKRLMPDTLRDVYMKVCDEDSEVADSMTDSDMLIEIYQKFDELKAEINGLEDDVEELESDKNELDDKVDSLIKQLNTGRNEPLDLEFELYKLNIPNPFTNSQMIEINNRLNELEEVEIYIY